MTAFDDRKTAAEAKFAHDQEFQFKTIARRNKLLGLWAAEQMGISGVDAEAYAKQVVIADFEEPGDADVLWKVLGDLTDKGIATDEHKVRHEMTRLLDEAKTVNGGAKLVHPGGAKLVHLTLCGTRCWGVVPVVHRRDPRCFE